MIKKVLIDTDVLLDVFLGREPHLVHSQMVLLRLDETPLMGCVTSTIVVNVFYHLRKNKGVELAFECIEDLITNDSITLLAVDKTVLMNALYAGMSDYEDAVQAAAAEREQIDLIVTRNLRDFKNSPVRAVSPKEFLTILAQNNN